MNTIRKLVELLGGGRRMALACNDVAFWQAKPPDGDAVMAVAAILAAFAVALWTARW